MRLVQSCLVSSEKLVRLVVNCTLSSARPGYLNALLLLFFGLCSCGVESCGCVILSQRIIDDAFAAIAHLHIFPCKWSEWREKAVSNDAGAASLLNVDFPLRGRTPML